MKMKNDLSDMIADLGDGFQAFTKKHTEEMTAMKNQLRAVETQTARVEFSGGTHQGTARPEALTAFNAFLRNGDTAAMREFAPQAAMSTQVGPDGGFAVPQEISDTIEKLELSYSPMRRFARVRTVSSDRPEQLVNVRGLVSGWVGEQSNRPDTVADSLAVVVPPMGEIYAIPSATQRLIDDAAFDLAAYIAESVAEVFAAQEGAGFATGNGINKPLGILSAPTSLLADATRPFGAIQFLKTGVAGAFAATNPGDVLVDLVHALRAPYRQGAAWWMNSKTLSKVRELKDGQGNYLWRAGSGNLAGQPDLLLGYPIAEDENVPDIAANSFAIGFGNFLRGYQICDHVAGVRMLRDPFTAKPYTKFYTTKRVGGSVINSQAIKLLQFAV